VFRTLVPQQPKTMLFTTLNIRVTTNSSTIRTKLLLMYLKLVTKTREEVTLFHQIMQRLALLEEENLDQSTVDLDQFKTHQAITTQTKLI